MNRELPPVPPAQQRLAPMDNGLDAAATQGSAVLSPPGDIPATQQSQASIALVTRDAKEKQAEPVPVSTEKAQTEELARSQSQDTITLVTRKKMPKSQLQASQTVSATSPRREDTTANTAPGSADNKAPAPAKNRHLRRSGGVATVPRPGGSKPLEPRAQQAVDSLFKVVVQGKTGFLRNSDLETIGRLLLPKPEAFMQYNLDALRTMKAGAVLQQAVGKIVIHSTDGDGQYYSEITESEQKDTTIQGGSKAEQQTKKPTAASEQLVSEVVAQVEKDLLEGPYFDFLHECDKRCLDLFEKSRQNLHHQKKPQPARLDLARRSLMLGIVVTNGVPKLPLGLPSGTAKAGVEIFTSTLMARLNASPVFDVLLAKSTERMPPELRDYVAMGEQARRLKKFSPTKRSPIDREKLQQKLMLNRVKEDQLFLNRLKEQLAMPAELAPIFDRLALAKMAQLKITKTRLDAIRIQSLLVDATDEMVAGYMSKEEESLPADLGKALEKTYDRFRALTDDPEAVTRLLAAEPSPALALPRTQQTPDAKLQDASQTAKARTSPRSGMQREKDAGLSDQPRKKHKRVGSSPTEAQHTRPLRSSAGAVTLSPYKPATKDAAANAGNTTPIITTTATTIATTTTTATATTTTTATAAATTAPVRQPVQSRNPRSPSRLPVLSASGSGSSPSLTRKPTPPLTVPFSVANPQPRPLSFAPASPRNPEREASVSPQRLAARADAVPGPVPQRLVPPGPESRNSPRRPAQPAPESGAGQAPVSSSPPQRPVPPPPVPGASPQRTATAVPEPSSTGSAEKR